jgi:hypothetical protein
MKMTRSTQMSNTRWIAAFVGLVMAQAVVATHLAGQATRTREWDYVSYTQIGAGGSTCGSMTKNLQEDRNRFTVPYLFWEQGFISGANYTSFRDKQDDPSIGKGVSPDALLAAMEKFCGENPSRTVGDAASAVYAQLLAER